MWWLNVQVEGMQLVIDDLVGSTGLELKVDPGVPYVYAGFAGKPSFAPLCWNMYISQSLRDLAKGLLMICCCRHGWLWFMCKVHVPHLGGMLCYSAISACACRRPCND